ncbi:E3 SUMO-protein ligase MMS21-like [Rutidosis leptorrhynchoides]|uniref:E3 SUMO-protein ligase MMS21-like n=1 Tax=Rutidosis leptorrhynchoides TaxID=125765 RepID=UPI003A98F87D
MASTSAHRTDVGSSRMKSAAVTLSDDNQTLLVDIRKAMVTMKDIGVSLERQNKTQKVKELENEFVELVKTYENCANLSTAIDSVGNTYRPGEQLTDFKKLIDTEMAKVNRRSSSSSQAKQLLRQFKEAIWKVHNHGQPMPGEEQEDIVMTSTQSNLLNPVCPLSGKPVIELSEPVRSKDCKHIYERKAIMQYIMAKNGQPQCPMAGCPKTVTADRVVCDPLLRVEIEESRAMNEQTARPNIIEDFTEGSEAEDSD